MMLPEKSRPLRLRRRSVGGPTDAVAAGGAHATSESLTTVAGVSAVYCVLSTEADDCAAAPRKVGGASRASKRQRAREER